MVDKHSDQVQACHEHAFDAKRSADAIADTYLKTGFLDLEKRWLRLARSYEFTEKLADFSANLEQPQRLVEQSRANLPHHALRLQKDMERVLRESDEHFRWLASIVEWTDDAIVSQNLDGIITSWNDGAERLYGYFAEETIGKPISMLVPPGREDEESTIQERVRRGINVKHFETVRRRRGGGLIDVSLTISPIRSAGGQIIGAARIAHDITERKRSEAQMSVLTREAEHRAKNLLANVQSIVRLSQSDTLANLKKAIEGRIAALANVHSLFVESRWTGAELRSLVGQELSPYSGGSEMRTRIDGPAVTLKPELAQAIAVALHELATNAAKYGALSAAKGQVRVEWSCMEDGQLVLRWTEVGGPRVDHPPTHKGFGTGVMESMIRERAKGRVQLDWRGEGLACEIVVPT